MKADEWTTSLAIRAAWMSFIGRSTQGEIAGRLGVSPAKVHRLIAHAQKEGLIKFHIEARPSECVELEQFLCKRMNLENCFIAPDLGSGDEADSFTAVSSFAGHYLHSIFATNPPKRIGVGMGRTLQSTIEAMPRVHLPELELLSVSGSLTRRLSANPYDVVQQLCAKTGGEGFYLPVPYIAETEEERDTFVSQGAVQELLSRAKAAELFIIGIGSVEEKGHLVQRKLITSQEREELLASGACSDVMGRFVDINGKEVSCSLNEKAVGLHFDEVREAHVVAIVGGNRKAKATLAALATGIIKDLIIDEVLARELAGLLEETELNTTA
ncbi:Transcriptional regulator LsrR [Pseudovibrio axinellae]|uniref:Transcriptional regulator LsrR n=1 Tax=Pseudovibrio axinellae TaxID=989403 RepID=A0A166B8T3_9HYPH|nr:sugar-binding domain-containing protein [Pseudovibrio axinellae]KZL22026.1 Transcriptional regulator LsrR [Pseudovibrio axinellae]SEQ58167.1 DNA-binding transcriptional regulator LsrR, DeoR family [Pseudovibrio axinellae]